MSRPDLTRKVLVIDDDADVRGLVRTLCTQAGAELLEAADGTSGLKLARDQQPDLILLDLVLPDADGIDIARQMRTDERLQAIPIVVLSGRRTQNSKVSAFEAGADDYIVKPFGLAEIDARIRANLRKRELYQKIERSNLELRLANERLAELATTDELTGLQNLRALRERLEEEFLRADRYETPLALVLVDLDGFKAVNDNHGHDTGDRLLSQLAQRLRFAARQTDIVARYGGDEFVFLLPHTGLEEAIGFAKRLQERIAATPLQLDTGGVAPVGLSCGVAAYPECRGITVAKELFAVADNAMYEAKRLGGRRVVAASAKGDPQSTDLSSDETKSPPPGSPPGAGGA